MNKAQGKRNLNYNSIYFFCQKFFFYNFYDSLFLYLIIKYSIMFFLKQKRVFCFNVLGFTPWLDRFSLFRKRENQT